MKKFMIFLLMAFLYLGTCQARSESAHPNDAKKLLSWVTPTPSQSFLARSEADATAATFKISPSGRIYLGETANNSRVLTVLPVDLGEKVVSQFTWYHDGSVLGTSDPTTTGSSTFNVTGLTTGTHKVWAVASFEGDAPDEVSDTVTFIVAQHDFTVDIVGLNEACEDYPVTLTAQISTTQLAGFSYTWKVDGETPTSLAYNGQTLTFIPSVLFGNSANQVHEFSVEVSYAGCSQELSPIHLFTTIANPIVTVTVPDTVCENVDPVYTATVDGLVPEHYEWYLKGSETPFATTTINTLTRPIAAGEDTIGVKATYSNTLCNSQIAWVKVPGIYTVTPSSENLQLTISPVYNNHKDTMCVGEQVTFTLQDNNTNFGAATYTWFVNGMPTEAINGNSYVATFDAVGNYEVVVNAAYANYPCDDVFSAKDTVVIMTAPAIEVAGNNVICAGDSATLIATQGFETYSWTGPGVPADNTTNSIKVADAGVYTVSGVTKYGCPSEEAENIEVVQFGADLQARASEYQVCPGTVVELNANLDGWNNDNIQYLWSNNATGSTLAVTIDKDTTFTVKAYILGNNSDTLCSMTQQLTITMIDEMLPAITVNADNAVCLGEQVTAKITDNTDYAGLYNWYFNGIEIPGEHLDSITLTMNTVGSHLFAAKRANYQCVLDTVVASTAVTVNAIPEILVTGDNVICQNDTAHLLATEITGAKYMWVGPDANIGQDSTYRQKTTIPGVYAVSAKSGDCVSAPAMFTVYQLGGDLQVYASEVNVCPGTVVALNANLDGFGNQNIEYTWTKVNDNTTIANNTGSTITDIPAPATLNKVTYKVTAVATTADHASAAQCVLNDSIDIYVIDTTNIPLVVTVGKEHICQGGQVYATATPVNSNQVVDYYTWYINGIEVPGQDLDSIVVNLNEVGSYYFSAKPAYQNCFDHAANQATKSVTVHQIPELTITGNNVVCNGDTAELTVAASTEDVYVYTWTPNTAIVLSNENKTMKTATSGIYTVNAKNQLSGCQATTDIVVTVFGADLQVTADNTVICDGESVVLNADLDGFNNQNITYTWKDGNNTINQGIGSTVTVTPSATTTYVVIAEGGDCSLIDTIQITVNPRPVTPTIAVTEAVICQGGQTQFEATPNSAHYTYIWTENGVELANEGRAVINVTLNEPGTYSYGAKIVDSNGCVSARVSEVASVQVLANPIVTLTGDHYYTTDANTATITANVIPAGEYTYAWSNGGTDSFITVSEYGVYTVTVTNEIGCFTVSEPFTVSSVVDLQVNITGVNAACINDVVTLTAVVDYDLEGHNYQWYVNGNPINNVTGPIYQFRADTLYERTGVYANDFQVEITRPSADCAPVMSPVHQVLITPAPLAVVIVPEKSCKGNDVTLKAQVYEIGGNAQYQYVWYKKAAGQDEATVYAVVEYIDTLLIPAAEVEEGNSYAVQVNFQDESCSSPVSEYVTIPLYSVPEAISLTVDPSQLCTAGQATYNVIDENSEEEFGAVTYDWYVNGVHAPGVHGDYFTGNFNYNGDFTVYVTATYAGYPCEVLYTNDTTIHVNMHPTVEITGDPIICEDNNIELFANLNDTVGSMNYTYEWRLYNYTLGNNSLDIPLFNISIPLPDSPEFMDESVWSTAMATSTSHLVVSTSLLSSLLSDGQFPAQDYPYIFTVVVTTPEGCRTVSEPYYVYVNEHPTVATTVDYNQVCAEGEINAVAHIGNYNTPDLVYQWQVRRKHDNAPFWQNDWQDIPYGTEPFLQHVPGVTSQYRIVVTQTTSGCVAESEPMQVDVIIPQAIDYIVAINSDDNYPTTNVCKGAQLNVTAYVDSLDENNQPTGHMIVDYDHEYVWRLNGIDLLNIHGPEFSTQVGIYDDDPVDYVYTAYMVYDIPGCELIEVASDTIHVKRNPIVTIDGNPNVCYFGPTIENVTLVAWVDGVVDNDATYTWFESGQRRPNTSGFDNKYKEMWRPTYLNPLIFTVEVTNGDGCTTISDPFEVNVYEKPAVNITGDANAICESGEVTLQANLNNYNDPMLTYQWYFDEVNNDLNRIDGATHEIQTFAPTRSTNYIVKVTHLMDFLDQFCVAYDTFRVEVNKVPKITADNDLAGVKTICEGRNVTLAVTSITDGVPGGEVYTWYRNGVVIPDANGPVYVDSPVAVDGEPTQYVYQVSLQQAASGCESPIFTLEDTITVNPNPSIELVTDPIVCSDAEGNVVLHANITPAIQNAGDVQYQWLEDNLQFAITTDPTYTLHKDYREYPYSFSVRTVNDYGCVSEASALVYVDSTPNVFITVNETQICAGGEITLAASLADYNGDDFNYQWKDNGVNIDGATEMTYTYAPEVGDHVYTFEVYKQNSGCLGVSKTALEVNVTVDPVVADIENNIPEENAVCDGYQVVLAAVVNDGVRGGEVYTWYRNGVVIEGAVDSIFTEVVSALNNEPTQYTYAVSVAQAAAGCESNVFTMGTFTVNPNPVVALVTDPIVCTATENNIMLVANVYPEVETGITFKWFEDNAVFASTEADTIYVTKPYRDYPYNFAVAIVNEYGCSAMSEALVYVNDTISVNISVTEDIICEGGVITLNAALANWNSDELVYQWYDNGEAMLDATSLSYTYAPAEGVHVYTFSVNQLTSGCSAISNALEVVVNPIPVVTSVVASDYAMCIGGQISITANVDEDHADRNDGIFTWYRNGILIEGATAATIFDTPGLVDNNIQQYFYSASVVYPEAGCSSEITADPLAVTIYPNPRVQITGDQHVCETDSVFLIANVDTTGYTVGNLHYTWYMDGQIRDNMAYNLGDRQFFAEYLYARTEPYTFTVDVWRGDRPNACVTQSESFQVYVYTQPDVTITATETEICTNGEVTLTANLVDQNADNLIYQWYEVRERQIINATGYDFENGGYTYDTVTVAYHYNIPGANYATYTTNVNTTTIFGVDVFQTNSLCSDNDEIQIIVRPVPEVTLVTVSDTLVCNGAQVTVAATIDTKGMPADGAVYTWYRNGNLIEGATGASFSENVFTTDNHETVNTYSAVVTLPISGCFSEVSVNNASVVIKPAPTTVAINGNNVICEGDYTILYAYSDVEGEFTWSNGSHADSIIVPAGSYYLTMTTVNGCEMTSDNFVVEAFGTDLLVSASATSICQGEHTTLYVNQDGWQGNVVYQWDAQANNSTATTVDVTPDITTTYHVTATVNSTNGSCIAEGEVTIVVNELPGELAIVLVNDTVCLGQQVYMAAVPAHAADTNNNNVAYIWYENGVEIPGENQPYLYVNENQVGLFVYAVKAISNEGCVSAVTSETVTVTVLPAPTTVTITGNNVICQGDSTVLTAQSDVPGIFTWSNGTIGATNVVTEGVYNVTIQTNEGCELTSDNFTVESFGTDLIVSASATAICEGEHTTLYVNQDGWQGNVTYAWSTGSTASTVDVTPEVTTTYTVTATVEGNNGSCTAVGEITIVVTPRPATVHVTVVDGLDQICAGQQTMLVASGDAAAYLWYVNGVQIEGENLNYLIVNQNEAGVYAYQAKAVNAEGCVSEEYSNIASVVVRPAPTQVVISGNNVICQGDSTILTAYSDVPGTFVWNDGTQGITKVVTEGVYNVTVYTAEGCELTSDNFTVESFGTDLLVSASATSICEGDHTTLYVNQDGWQGNVTYAWSTGSTATTVDVTPTVTTTYQVTATVTSNNSACVAEGEVTIVVNPRPASPALVVVPDTVCVGQQYQIAAVDTTFDHSISGYIWYENGVEMAGENQFILMLSQNEPGIYRYAAKAVTNEGCVSASASLAAAVRVMPAPTTVTITGNNILCQNDSTILYAHSDVPGTFTWNDGTTGATKVVEAGVYNVTLTTDQGCSLTSQNFTVEAFGTELLVNATATNICEGDHTTLTVEQDGWIGNVTYEWSNGSTATTIDVAPAVTTVYTVTATVANAAGTCTAVGEITINVNPRPAAPVVYVAPDTICTGEQFAVVDINNYQYDQYTWYMNGQEIEGQNLSIISMVANQAGRYLFSARAISEAGCVSELSNDFATFAQPTLVVIDAPQSVVITGNDNFCDGGYTILNANVVTTAPASQVTYTWFKDGVDLNTNADHITVTAAGSYKVIATVYGKCSTESTAFDVFVQQTPQLQLTATEETICAGGRTVITAEATGWNNSDVIYNWSNGFQGSVYTFDATYSGTYTFTVTASQATSGCEAVDQLIITVNELPAIPQVTVDNAVICDGGQVTLTVTNPNNNAEYIWKRNGIVIPDANGPIFSEFPVTTDGDQATFVYTVVAQIPMSGCTSLSSSNTVVTVISTPEVAVSVEGNTTVCEGGSTILHANVNPVANYNYQWYKDNNPILGANQADYTVTELARETAYDFHVVVTANAGCQVVAHADPIIVVADPVVVATISNDITCVGGTATMTAIVDGGVDNVNGMNPYTYQWYRNIPNGASTLVATTREYTTSVNDAVGNYSYWVVVTSNYGCQSESLPVNFSIVADPVVSISVANGYASTVCDGASTALRANVTGGYGEISYQWYKNGIMLAGETNEIIAIPVLNYGDNDTYAVEITQTGVGCASAASVALGTLVTIHPTYTVDITGFGNVCEGGTLTLNATVNNGQIITGDVLGYQWYRIVNGDDAVAIQGATSAQYTTSDLLMGSIYDYYVVVTSNVLGCSTVSNTVPANVVARPTVTINGANTVCEGGDLTLNAFVSGGVEGAAYTYTWSWTGAAQGSTTTATPSFVPSVSANDAATPYYFTVTISRADNTGCTATSEAHEVNVQAVPTVSITADNNYVCTNGQVTFTAHVAPVGSYNYAWIINDQAQVVNANTITASLTTTGTISAQVTVSAAGASSSCSAVATLATPVQVVAAPTVTLAANHTTMCVGGVTTLTATVNANNNIPSNFTYEWSVDGTPVAGVSNILNQTLNDAGNHYYQVVVSQNSELGCVSVASAPVTIQVAEQPVVTLSSADGLAICEGGSVTLTGVVTNYGNNVNGVTNSAIYGNLTFDWNSNGVNVHHNTPVTNAMNQVTETLNTVGNYSYQVVVTPSGYNCQPQVSNTEIVNVVGNPSWTEVHVYSSNLLDGCIGDMVTLNAEIQGGAFDYANYTGGHIQWTVTDGNGNTVNVSGGLGGNSYDLPAAAGTYIYTPTYVGNIGSGCQLTNTAAVQAAITIHDLPTAVFTSGDGTALCANDGSASAELVISFTGVAPFHYEVVDGNGNIVAAATTMSNPVSVYVAPSEQTTYRIVMVADAFCENTSLTADAMATVYVNKIEFTENFFESGCNDNGQVTIHFNMISGNPTAAFTVVYDNGMTANGNISNNSATFAAPTTPGDYNAVFTVDGCSYDIVVRVLAGDYAFGGSLPIMDQRWNDVVVVNNNPATNGGHTFVGFQWYRNGVAIPGATYSNYQEIGGLNGFYSVELIEQDANGNMITYKTCEMYFNAVSTVKVYPVPANVRQEITIELDLTAEELEGAILDIYNVNGALIDHVTNLTPITKIEGFKAQGTYFGRILTGTNEIKTVKFVIVK